MKLRPMTGGWWNGVVILCLALPVWSEVQKPGEPVAGLQAVLDIPESAVAQGEYLGVDLELRNVANTPFSLYRNIGDVLGMPGMARFRVRRTDGTPVEITQITVERAGYSSPEDYIRLSPGESLRSSLKMYPQYRDDEAESLSDRFKMLEPGRYELHLEISFTNEGKQVGVQDAWVGTVFSNSITFEVVPTQSRKKL